MESDEKMKILTLMLWIIIYSCLCYEKRCPYHSERRLQARIFCNGSLHINYSCLFDENLQRYFESCREEPDYVRAGYKYVITGNRRDLSCSGDMYQPFIFWSNESSDCVFKKSTFSESGQIPYNNGSNKEDRNLRCDYSKGYAFVTLMTLCYCTPSVDDCSCYKKTCENNTILSADYNCVKDDSNWICPRILEKEKNTEQEYRSDLKQEDRKIRLGRLVLPLAAIAVVIAIIILMLVFLLPDWLPSVCYETINPPDNVKIAQDKNCIQLIWSEPSVTSQSILGYNIEYTFNDWINSVSINVPANVFVYTFNGLWPEKTYRFKVSTCISDTRKSHPSNEAITQTFIPESPSPVEAVGENGNIKVMWTRVDSTLFTITHYNIQYTCDEWETTTETHVEAENLSYLLSGVQLHVPLTYRFRVFACTKNLVKGYAGNAIFYTGKAFHIQISIENPDTIRDAKHINSVQSEEVKENLQKAVNNILQTDQAKIKQIGFSNGSLIASFLLAYDGVLKETEIQNAIETAVKGGSFGIYKTKYERFSFSMMHKPEPPQAVTKGYINNCPSIIWKTPIPTFYPITHYKLETTTDNWKTKEEKTIAADEKFYIIDTVLLSKEFLYKIYTCTSNDMISSPAVPDIPCTNETDSNLTSNHKSSILMESNPAPKDVIHFPEDKCIDKTNSPLTSNHKSSILMESNPAHKDVIHFPGDKCIGNTCTDEFILKKKSSKRLVSTDALKIVQNEKKALMWNFGLETLFNRVH